MNVRPLRNLIFVKPEPLKSGSIDLSGLENHHTLSEKFNVSGVGEVVAVNSISEFSIGDRVFFGPNVGLGFEYEGENYLCMRDGDIDSLLDADCEIVCDVGHWYHDKA